MAPGQSYLGRWATTDSIALRSLHDIKRWTTDNDVRDLMPATLSFREALNEGIASGTFVDTKIILFSRKNSTGRVYGPKTLYATSHVLKSITYFNHREPLTCLKSPAGNLTIPSCKFSLETF